MTQESSSTSQAVTTTEPPPRSFTDRLKTIKSLYPDPRSAVMPALYLAQEHYGFITDEAINWVSEQVGLAPVHVREVATFYTMYYKKPVGKYHFQVCRTLTCSVRGAKKITNHLEKKFKIKSGEVSKDGMWSYEEVECLGSCGTAPMCEINDTYFENLTEDKLDEIINKIAKGDSSLKNSSLKNCNLNDEKDLRFKTSTGKLNSI